MLDILPFDRSAPMRSSSAGTVHADCGYTYPTRFFRPLTEPPDRLAKLPAEPSQRIPPNFANIAFTAQGQSRQGDPCGSRDDSAKLGPAPSQNRATNRGGPLQSRHIQNRSVDSGTRSASAAASPPAHEDRARPTVDTCRPAARRGRRGAPG
jgi:hypothetical protein